MSLCYPQNPIQHLQELAMRIHYPAHSHLYLGAGRVFYCGPLQHLENHRYGCAVLHVGVYRPFKIKLAGGDWQSGRCVVVPPGVRHALDMDGGVHGKLFVERDSPTFPAFKRRFPCQGRQAVFFADGPTLECFRRAFEENPQREALEAQLDRWLGIEAAETAPVDLRLLRVIERMAGEMDCNHSQEELAELAGLSPSRFQHLFCQQMGVPYRRYRLWRRVVAATKHMHGLDHMTRAALDSGFADATHFSHSFRDTFGVNPAAVFRTIQRFEA